MFKTHYRCRRNSSLLLYPVLACACYLFMLRVNLKCNSPTTSRNIYGRIVPFFDTYFDPVIVNCTPSYHDQTVSFDTAYVLSFNCATNPYPRKGILFRSSPFLGYPRGRLPVLLLANILAGDISLNPGPKTKYPCGVCSKACKWKQDCIACDQCETWLHRTCINMSPEMFKILGNSSCTWICDNCGLPLFDSSFWSSRSFEHNNSFAPLDGSSDMDSSISSNLGEPSCSSSPIITSRRKNSADSNTQNSKRLKHCWETVNTLRIVILNLQGLLNKLQAFTNVVADSKAHVILATETWLSPDVRSSECFPPNYTVFRKDRIGTDTVRGGVLIAVRNDIIATHVEDLDVDTEVIWVKL